MKFNLGRRNAPLFFGVYSVSEDSTGFGVSVLRKGLM